MGALFFTINKFVLSDWEIDCKWKLHEHQNVLIGVYKYIQY